MNSVISSQTLVLSELAGVPHQTRIDLERRCALPQALDPPLRMLVLSRTKSPITVDCCDGGA